jgi:PAS domain S-box-containing protein
MQSSTQSNWRVIRAYLLTALALAVCIPLRLLLDPLLGDKMPFVTVFPVVVVAAWWAGVGPALMATALGSAGIAFFVLEPRNSFTIASPEYRVGIIVNAVVCLACIAIFASLRRARMLAEGQVEEGKVREHQLEHEMAERAAAEASLRASEERFRGIFDQAAVGVGQTNLDRMVIDVNPGLCRMLGYSREELIGQHVADLTHPEEQEWAAATMQPLIDGNVESVSMDRRFRHKHGHYVSTHASASVIRDEKGVPQSVVAVVQDITERKLAEQALREADRRKDEFLATLAHELRNPLAPICNSLHILRLAGADAAAHEPVVEMMERQIGHMVRLVDDLLEMSRITRGKIELRKERVELAAVIRSAVEASQPMIDAGNHQLAISLPAEPITLEADPVRMAQVFSNLLNNSAKYTDRGGHIRLSVRTLNGESRPPAEVEISVRDTGIGIEPEMLPRVFDMFTQVSRSRRQAQPGLGIGLTLVRNLVELHGGSVEARSAGLGKGSEFVVRLPVAKFQPAAKATAAQPVRGEISLQPRHVLVVDDNRDAAESLAVLLRRMGLEVQVAYSGPEALDTLAVFDPDVIFLDIGMPVMDGYELVRRIRDQVRGRDRLVIALTGWGQEEDRRKSREAGFDYHLTKPVDLAQLQSLLVPSQVIVERLEISRSSNR